jgi:hypothetical protein
MEGPEKLMNTLKDFFNLAFRCMVEFHKLGEGKSELQDSEFKEYTYGQFGVIIRNYAKSELTYVSFLEEYEKMVSKWLEAFSGLVGTLGSREYHRILLKGVELGEVIYTSEIDVNFLKFRIENFLNPSLSDLETICGLLLEKSENVLEEVNRLNAKPSHRFIELVENQARDWLMVHEEVQIFLERITQIEDKSQIIFALSMITRKFIDFFEKINEARKFVKISDENWEHFVAGGFIEFSDQFKKIKEDMIQLFDYIVKIYEHLDNCFLHILAVLWGREVAQFKIEDVVKSKIPAEDLVPKIFSIKDLAFALALARSELGQAYLASQGLDEKMMAMDMVANQFPMSQGVQDFRNRITGLLEMREKYLTKINDVIIDIQKMIQQNVESEKLIFSSERSLNTFSDS